MGIHGAVSDHDHQSYGWRCGSGYGKLHLRSGNFEYFGKYCGAHWKHIGSDPGIHVDRDEDDQLGEQRDRTAGKVLHRDHGQRDHRVRNFGSLDDADFCVEHGGDGDFGGDAK